MFKKALVWAPLLLLASQAQAHVVFVDREAAAGTYFRAALAVSHGCEGSPTRTLSVQIPDGVIGVKPMPKPGWKLTLKQGAYARPYTLHGKTVEAGVKEIRWTGELADAHYDEFVFRVYLADALPAGELAFAVVQDCAKGSARWVELPAAGAAVPAHPAPLLRIAPAVDPHAGHQH